MIVLEDMDIVIPVREGEDNESLRYCLRSIAANMPHRKIIIAGYKPSWVTGVHYVAVKTLEQNKYRRVALNILAGAEFPKTSDWFMLFNDDMFVLDPMNELMPFHRGNLIEFITSGAMDNAPKQRESIMLTYNALIHAGIKSPLNYELHMPMIMSRFGLLDLIPVLQTMRLEKSPIQLRSFYGNMHHIGGEQIEDTKIAHNDRFSYQEYFPVISTTERSFNHGLAGEEIRERFPNKCHFEV